MNSLKIFIFFIILLTFSCKKNKAQEDVFQTEKPRDTTLTNYTLKITENLQPKAKELVKDWGEYQKIDEFLRNNQNTNAEETLFNAEELARLAQELKDSIRIETFKTPDYRIRLNVINNEALRLKDMSTIPNLSANEVLSEYQKIFEAFNALNSKLNNKVSKEKINKELKDFIDAVATDSVVMDTVKYEEFK
ncbi:MAG: hypothetical protein DSY82_04320 [Flavobacteriia bacterium]|nr:MAG: hypothetical protein DSY82_04320 [Flavobacteriia bacterium]